MNTATHRSIFVIALTFALTCGAPVLPTHAAGTPVKFQIKPLSQTYKNVKNMATRLDIYMKGKMASGKIKADVDGNLVFDLTLDNVKKSKAIVFSGEMFNQMLAQQSTAPGGMTIDQMGIYLTGKDLFVHIEGGVSACIKSKISQAKQFTDLEKAFAPDQLLGTLGSSSKTTNIEGVLIGTKKLNGIETKHYSVDSKTFAKITQTTKSKNKANVEYKNVEVWVASEGSYLVKVAADGTGDFAGVSQGRSSTFDGAFDMSYELLGINNDITVTLPKKCDKPISS
jgi:hypothetical protein